MLLNATKAENIFRKVRNLKDQYSAYVLGGDSGVLRIEDFHRVIEESYNLKILKTTVAFEGENIRGQMERYDDKILIRIRRSQTLDWLRFATVKEFCHIVIDEQEDWSADGVGTIEKLVIEYQINNDQEAEITTQSEMFAEIAAIEIMYPFQYRIVDLEELKKQNTTIVKIASHYGLPAFMVSRALSDSYHEGIAKKLWESVTV
jgi:Zn-dependent peptidase ImmA (M78 family)